MLKIAMIDTIGDEILNPGDHQELFTEVGDGALLFRASAERYPPYSGKVIEDIVGKAGYAGATHLILNFTESLRSEVLVLLPELRNILIPKHLSEEELTAYSIDPNAFAERGITLEYMRETQENQDKIQWMDLRKKWVKESIMRSCEQPQAVTQS